MKVVVLAVGKLRSAAYGELAADYIKKAGRFSPVEMEEVRDAGPLPSKERVAREGADLLRHLSARDRVVLCDERGGEMTTRQLADYIDTARAMGGAGRLVFIMGGSEGVSDDVRERADLVLALTRMTLPHELARVVLLEQIFRAFSLLADHPYHRD